LVLATQEFDWDQLAKDWVPGYQFISCTYGAFTGSNCSVAMI
jgi:hypothetical protein